MHHLARIAAALLIVLALTPLPLSAHSSQNSELRLSTFGDRVEIEVVMPASDYMAATRDRSMNDDEALSQASAVLGAHLSIRSRTGVAWLLSVEQVELTTGDGPADLKAKIIAHPTGDQAARTFMLDWRLFSPDNPGGLALVILSRDPSGAVGSQEKVLGAMTRRQTSLTVDLGQTNSSATAINAFLIGAHHILEGYDHLLFLLALMLPAPLLARNARWQQPRAPRSAAWRIIVTVTAFTLGHSVTFVIASVWPMSLSAVVVESIIALSVFVSALHAIRPIFAANEPAIGFTFGLVHGLAFATLLSESALGASMGAASLIGFTLGIEAIQLALVLCAMPALILLAPSPAYTFVRVGLASAILFASVLWLLNRLFGVASTLVDTIETAISFSLIPVAALLILAAAVLLWRKLAGSDHVKAIAPLN